MRWLTVVLLLLLALLQYRLWFAEGSLAEQKRLEAAIRELESINAQLHERNRKLEADVLELKSGYEGIEARARSELGMIREGEVFYQVVPRDEKRDGGPPPNDATQQPPAQQKVEKREKREKGEQP